MTSFTNEGILRLIHQTEYQLTINRVELKGRSRMTKTNLLFKPTIKIMPKTVLSRDELGPPRLQPEDREFAQGSGSTRASKKLGFG